MPIIHCDGCDRPTNSALCDWIFYPKKGAAERCYAAWDIEKNSWVKGCAYEKADLFMQKYVDKLIKDVK